MGAYRVTTPWSTGATWNTTNGSTPWHTPGGDFSNPPEAESDAAINSTVGAKKGWDYWYPTKMVQEWYNGTNAPNGQGQPDLGFLLKDVSEGPTNNVVSFDGREEREHAPGLTLEWSQRGVGNATNYTELPMQLSPTLSMDVNPASGNLMIHSDDLKVPSKGMEFDSARTWNSLQNEAFGYGYGWVDSNAPSVHVTPTGSVAYTDGTGATFPFVKERANFATPPGIEATLCEAGSAAPCPVTLPKGITYQLIYTNTQERINFKGNQEYNYPQEVLDAAGEAETAKYTKPLELPTTWTDTEKVKIAYTESESLGYTKITNEGNGHSVSYTEKVTEDGLPHLLKYTNENKETTSYTIGTGLEGNLIKEITEPNGTVIKLSYDSQYRITKIIKTTNAEHTTGPTTTYTYYGYGKAPAPCTATQKATVIAETGGSEEPTLTYCSNVLDEVEQVYGYPQIGQPGWYALHEETPSEMEVANVNVASGNFTLSAEDVVPNASDSELALNRIYNAQGTSASGVLGPHWRWGTGPGLYIVDDGASVFVHGPGGYVATLKRTGFGTYAGPTEYEGVLTKSTNGTYTLTNHNNPTYQFNSAGQLTSETAESGASFSIADVQLSGGPALQKITAEGGASVQIAYGAGGRAETTSYPGGVAHYSYNGSGQLVKYTGASGEITEYGYDSNGYLNRITTSEGTVETITTSAGRTTEVAISTGGELTTDDRFSYQAPSAPTCEPAIDSGETVVTAVNTEATTVYCYTALGLVTGPRTEAEEPEIEGEGEPAEISPGACAQEHPGGYCGENEPAPEPNEEEGGPQGRTLAGIAAARAPQLAANRYGISDNNRTTAPEGEEHPHFNIFTNPYFQALHVTHVRRIVPWNLVLEAQRGVKYDVGLLKDLEAWVRGVKAIPGGEALITFDHCYEALGAAGKWFNPETKAEEECGLTIPKARGVYKQAVEAFLNHELVNPETGKGTGEKFGELIKSYTAWDEPDNEGKVPNDEGEYVEPTWKEPKVAGEYWAVLNEFCDKLSKYACKVAAGDFLDARLPNVFNEYLKNKKTHKSELNPHWVWMQHYLAGMEHPRTTAYWAWHAYEDDELTETPWHLSHPEEDWKFFHKFEAMVKFYTPKANIWLTEQGVVYTEPGRVNLAGRSGENTADAMMRFFVHRKKLQLTRQSGMIKYFYYYEMLGEQKAFDSGLLEAPAVAGKTFRKRPELSPRGIFPIYERRTTGKD